MKQSEKYNFHDQSVAAFSSNQDEIHLTIDCFDDEADAYKAVTILFKGVSNASINDVANSHFETLSVDGEILTFELKENHAFILIEWLDIKTHVKDTKAYRFSYKSEVIISDERK